MATPFSFGGWLQNGSSAWLQSQWALRAEVQQGVILMKQVDVALKRNGTVLDPQTVRLEFEDTFSQANSEVGSAVLRRGTLHGIHGHPELDDTDVEVWDTFSYQNMEFTIVFVNRLNEGQVQAEFEVIG